MNRFFFFENCWLLRIFWLLRICTSHDRCDQAANWRESALCWQVTVYLYMFVYTYIYIYTYSYLYVYVWKFVHFWEYVPVTIDGIQRSTDMKVPSISTSQHICIYLYLYLYLYICICIHIYFIFKLFWEFVDFWEYIPVTIDGIKRPTDMKVPNRSHMPWEREVQPLNSVAVCCSVLQ